MNWILALPWTVRLAALGLIGAVVGALINRGIYRLSWEPRSIGPWVTPADEAPPRSGWDLIPIIGWWGLRRESELHGTGYWIRPLLIELAVIVGLPTLYWFEITGHLLPPMPPAVQPGQAVLHSQFLAHAILISLMLVATFIDFDDQTIPDLITVPGMLIGLIVMAVLPTAQMSISISAAGVLQPAHLVLTTANHWEPWTGGLGGPLSWPIWLSGTQGLAIGLGCFGGWYLAILPKTWTTRRGWLKAVQYLFASTVRHYVVVVYVPVLACGLGCVVAAWMVGGTSWQSVLSSLVGMAVAGGLIWAIRIIGTYALHKEAMGFGDVTLMAMIGVYIGWQPSLISVFFLAPAGSVVIALTQWLVTGRRDLAFGPYLCLAAVLMILLWPILWTGWAEGMFSLGWLVPGLLATCLVLMAGMLSCWRILQEFLYGAEE